MASLNQVSIELKVSGEREATQALKRYSSASERLTRSVLDAASKIESTTNAWNRANKLYEKGVLNANALKAAQTQLARELAVTNGYLKSNGALNTQKALAELKAAQATQESAAAEARANAERQRAQQSYNQLRASIDQSYAARMRLRQAAQTLRAAEQQGIITREQAIEQLRQYRTQMQVAASTSNVLSEGQRFAGRNISRAGVLTQQAGYQIGDFIVQVQSGTNAFVAFGQQATQVAGTLTLLGGKWIAIGTVLGITIPLVTALGAAFMRTRGSVEEATEEVRDFSDYIRDSQSAIDDAADSIERLANRNLSDLVEKYRDLGEEITLLEQRLNNISLRNAVNEVQNLLSQVNTDEFADSVTSAIGGLGAAIVSTNEEEIQSLQRQLEEARSELRNLITLGQEDTPAYRNMLEITVDLREEIAAATGDVEEMGSLLGEIDFDPSLLSSFRELPNILKEAESASDFRLAADTISQMLTTLEQVGVEIDQGVGANLVKAEDILRQMVARLQENEAIANDVGDAFFSVWDNASKISGAIDSATVAAGRLNSRLGNVLGTIGSILGSIGRIGFENIALEAENRALEAGMSQGQAIIEGQMAQFMAENANSLPQVALEAAALTRRQALEEQLRLRTRNAALTATDTGGGGGGGGAGATGFVSMFPELQAAFEQAQELAKAYGEEVKILESALEQGLITQQEYNSYVAQAQEAYNQSAEAANQYEDIILRMANTTSDAIGQAMMDIVTGTKSASDAFSDMAQIILKKAFELLVINPIINSIFGGSGLNIAGFNPLPAIGAEQANGGVWSGGAQVQAFATGGVVGSPTFFPMANGNVGLMGEAGPEAIMPLKRGKGGRLGVEVSGEQGNVVINQTFAFQANGDDSVKRIIASEAPKIAALTQKQMLDARRRGGVVRDTFA